MRFYGIFVFVSFCILALIVARNINKLKSRGISPISGKSKKVHSFFVYPLFTIILFLWLFEVSKFAFQFSFLLLPVKVSGLLFESVFLKISGILIILISLFFLKITLIQFGNSLRFGFDKNNPGKLITTGIFSISRNPFFLSLDFYFYGTALIFPSIFFICFAALSIVSIHFFILKEEKFMYRIYGEEYENYKKEVKRYIDVSKR